MKANSLVLRYNIITTYGTMLSDFSEKETSPLFKRKWGRVILDEAHCIKNYNSAVAEASCNLKAKFRWCLTGTPIQNSLMDLYSLFNFLKDEDCFEDVD